MNHQRIALLLLYTLAHGLSIPQNVSHSPRDALPASAFTYEPIMTGYVAFGDSYAAGIGAGSTSSDGCRVGLLSHPNQLNIWVESLQPNIDFQNLPCSGAVITDVLKGGSNSQIDKWTNPSKADRATISIGGNDVGFYNVLTSCVLRVGSFVAGDCDYYIGQAYNTMNGAEFVNNVKTALRQIIDKSGRSDFRIIQTGYPTFFNNETDSCDYTTFYFWEPGHHGFHRSGNWAYLEKPLRTKLNKLVSDLNTQLQAIGNTVNQDFSNPRVLFADPNPAFKGHRFCEDGITEPDSGNLDNWLFLASWPDNSLPGTNSAKLSRLQVGLEEALGRQSIPDAATCASTHDWGNLTLCDMAKAGVASNSGAKVAFAQTIELPDGSNISTSEIGWLIPTNYAKTFHPRSLGHLGYRDLIRGTW